MRIFEVHDRALDAGAVLVLDLAVNDALRGSARLAGEDMCSIGDLPSAEVRARYEASYPPSAWMALPVTKIRQGP